MKLRSAIFASLLTLIVEQWTTKEIHTCYGNIVFKIPGFDDEGAFIRGLFHRAGEGGAVLGEKSEVAGFGKVVGLETGGVVGPVHVQGAGGITGFDAVDAVVGTEDEGCEGHDDGKGEGEGLKMHG